MLAAKIALAALLLSAADAEPVVLSPESIAKHGFHLESTFARDKNAQRDTDAGTLHLRLGSGPTGSSRSLEAIKLMTLILREGDAILLSVPVKAEFDPSNYVSLHAKLKVQKELLAKMRLAFVYEDAGGTQHFVVELKDFTKIWPPEQK